MYAIQLRDLTKRWGETTAVDSISFQVKTGEVFGFLGPNGAGKTSTIKMLVGLTEPTSGTAKVAGFDVVEESTKVKNRIGVVPESSNLYDELTVVENLRFVSKLYHVPKKWRQDKISELLEVFQMMDYADRDFGKLSKGLKRRAVLAASLVHDPEILFLDEPTSGLDIMSARSLRKTISELAESGVTVFLTSHYIEEAGLLCDRIAVIVKGTIIELDTPDALRNRIQETPLLKIKVEAPNTLTYDMFNLVPSEDIQTHQDEVSILTNDIDKTLAAFVKVAKEYGIRVKDIQTVKPRLEDAFIHLTGLSPDEMMAEKEA